MLLPLAVEWVSFRRYNKTALLLLKRGVLTVWATSMHFDRRPRWGSIAFPQPGLPHHIIHSLAELFIRNFPISSFISLFEQMFPKLVVHLDSPILFIWIKDLLEIFFWQLTIFVHIKKLESLSDVFLVDEGLSVNTCRNELLEVYDSVAVHITFLDDLLPILTGHILVFFCQIRTLLYSWCHWDKEFPCCLCPISKIPSESLQFLPWLRSTLRPKKALFSRIGLVLCIW